MKIDWMMVALAAGAVLAIYSFWSAHRRKDFAFNAFDLLMENGRVSRIAVLFMMTGLVSSWVIVHREISGTLTEGFFGLWLTAFVAPIIAVMTKQKPQITDKSPQ